MKHYEISEEPVLLDPDTFNPYRTLKLKIFYAGQQDGHGWTEQQIKDATDELLEAIKLEVERFVREARPFC